MPLPKATPLIDKVKVQHANESTTSKLMPLDFTLKDHSDRTYKIIKDVQEIMNSIEGPKVLSLNPNQATSVPTLKTEDGTTELTNPRFFQTGADYNVYTDHCTYNTAISSDTLSNVTPIKHLFRYVRRKGDFADGIAAVTEAKVSYDNNASRNMRNAPNNSLFNYPYMFSNYSVPETTRPLCVKYAAKWLNTFTTTTVASGTKITILKLSTVEQNIANNVPFDANTTLAFPRDAVPLDLTHYSGNKLAFFGTRIIDMSNTVTDTTITLSGSLTIYAHDNDLAQVLDMSLIKQDIDFALFFSSVPLLRYRSTAVAIKYYDFEFDPVEAIFSYLTAKKYESTDYTLKSLYLSSICASEYGCNLIMSYRMAASYLLQEAKKQLRYWITSHGLLTTNTYSLSNLENKLIGSHPFDFVDESITSNRVASLAWVPYEYVKHFNDTIEFDNYGWTGGKGGNRIPKKVRKPRSFCFPVVATSSYNWLYPTSVVNPYVQQYNNSCQCPISGSMEVAINAWPTAIVDVEYDNGHLYHAKAENEDNLIHYDYVDNSNYFPEPDIVTDI